jgi:DNA transformation protein
VSAFHAFVVELFAGLGTVRVKKMFGGAGVYAGDVMFAMFVDDAIYLKVDDVLKAALAEEAGSAGPFIWRPQSGPRVGEAIDMGYWRLPDAALDDPDDAARWGANAVAVARAKAKPKRARKKAAR